MAARAGDRPALAHAAEGAAGGEAAGGERRAEQRVLFVAVAATAVAQELARQRVVRKVGDTAQERVDPVEGDGAEMGVLQGCEPFGRRGRRRGQAEPVEIEGEVVGGEGEHRLVLRVRPSGDGARARRLFRLPNPGRMAGR